MAILLSKLWDWQWASSELWCGQCGERAGIFSGMGGVSRGLCTVQVRSLLLRLSQILVSLAEGMVLLEALPEGWGMYLLPSAAVALAVGFPGDFWWG